MATKGSSAVSKSDHSKNAGTDKGRQQQQQKTKTSKKKRATTTSKDNEAAILNKKLEKIKSVTEWPEEDILKVLQECDGNVDFTIDKILSGSVNQQM